MIFYLSTQSNSFTIYEYLNCGIGTLPPLRPLSYESVLQARVLHTGTYIFSDLDRLSQKHLPGVMGVWSQLRAAGGCVRLLNHPTASMGRYELLRTLYEKGINLFNVYRLTECRFPRRFPVFVRGGSDHSGTLTPLLWSQGELENAIECLSSRGLSREDLLVVEFVDTADEYGIYRKYAAFVVDGKVIPRHIQFSRTWMVKQAVDDKDEGRLREERTYLEDNPHAEQLQTVARLARIDYGRIDYSLLEGRPQIWEINTNPDTLRSCYGGTLGKALLQKNHQFAERFAAALVALDTPSERTVRLSPPQPAHSGLERFLFRETVIGRTLDLLPHRLRPTARKQLLALFGSKQQMRRLGRSAGQTALQMLSVLSQGLGEWMG
jgi:hypothetical protein